MNQQRRSQQQERPRISSQLRCPLLAEKREEEAFLTEAMKTPCVQYLHRYLAAKGKAPKDPRAFKTFLHDLWFVLYRRKVHRRSRALESLVVALVAPLHPAALKHGP